MVVYCNPIFGLPELRTEIISYGDNRRRHDESSAAIAIWERVLRYSLENPVENIIISKCYNDLGLVFRSLGQYEIAIKHHNNALEIAESIQDEKEKEKVKSYCYGNLGLAYDGLNNYQQAIYYYKQALKIAESIQDRAGQSKTYTNLGVEFRKLGRYQEAINYYNKALEIAIIEDREGQSKCYGNLGLAYQCLGQFQEAIKYHNKALEIAKRIEDLSMQSNIYINLGQSHQLLGSQENAYSNYKLGIDLQELVGDKIIEEYYKIWFNGTIADTYELMISACLGMKEEIEKEEKSKNTDSKINDNPNSRKNDKSFFLGKAFEYTERSKSRALLAMLSSTIDIRSSSGILE